ncbi:MAG: insulinase family protein, partial [Acidobacteriota bacterium]
VRPLHAQARDIKRIKFPPLHAFNVPQPERVVLDNGMVLLLLEDHELPLVEMRARIHVGSRDEPASKAGLATLFGQVWRTGGTRQMDGDAIDDFLESRAAIIETGAGEDSTFATVSALKEDFPEVLDLFVDILRHPVFNQEKIEVAKNQQNSAIARRNDNPQGIMSREFSKLIYGSDSPYARTTEYETIQNISREDLLAFHDRFVHPNRMILGVTGDFRKAEMIKTLRRKLGDWPKGPPPEPVAASYQEKNTPGIYYVNKEDMTQSNIIMGHLGIRKDNPDIFAVAVLNEVFGGSFAARLFSNVRSSKGLAYAVRGSVNSNYDHPGTFSTWMTTKTETTAAGIDALLEEIRAIVGDKPPTPEEVPRAKESILNSFVFNFDSRSEIIDQQITYEYFGFPRDYLSRYRENIEKVTPADVARVAKKYIHPDRLSILVVGPSKGLDRPLDSFGKVAKLDISIPEPKAQDMPQATSESLAKGKELFAKVVEGLGGAEAVDAVTAIKTVADTTLSLPQGQLVLKVVSTVAIPDQIRQEIQTPMGSMLMIIDGDKGFMDMAGRKGPMPESQRAQIRGSVKREPLVLARSRAKDAFQVQYLGDEDLDGTKVGILLVTLESEPVKLFVEKSTGHVVRQEYHGPGPAGQPGDHVTTFSDFRDVAGLSLPFKSESTFNGKPQQSSVSHQIQVNPPLDAAMFDTQGSVTVGATDRK